MIPSTKKTLEQARALAAWNFNQSLRQSPKREDTKRLAKQLPVRIMSAGLGHALAFTKQKGGDELLADISAWVAQRLKPTASSAGKSKPDIIERIIHGDADFLRRATDEILAYLIWINRFAEAESIQNPPHPSGESSSNSGGTRHDK
jgi:CRISPR-associated protein Cmr5